MTVKRDLARHAWSNGGERFAKEGLCGRNSAISAQEEVDRLGVFVDGTVKVVPAAADGNIRLIHSPGCSDRSRESAPAFLVLRHVSENPSKDRGVCNADAALSHELDQVSVREPVADVPPHTEFDDLGVEDRAGDR
jgi:hypothetical protein